MIDLDNIEKLGKEATPGPWRSNRYNHTRVWAGSQGQKEVWPGPDNPTPLPRLTAQMRANAAYIASVSPDVTTELIGRLRRFENALQACRLHLAECDWGATLLAGINDAIAGEPERAP